MVTVSMSKREFSRREALHGVQSGRLRVADVCTLTGLGQRQAFRLLQGLRISGAASLVSKRRGRRSNRQMPDEVRQLALTLVLERYCDFGPTLAAEKLAELHGCKMSHETLRRIASPGMLPSGGPLPHLECSRPGFGGDRHEADQHGNA